METRDWTVADGRAFLAEHDLLGHLSEGELDRLLSCARVERHGQGRVLFRKGDPGDRLFVVLDGRVKIGAVSEDGKEAVFNVLGRGEVFGEIALLDGKARTADATAMTDCHLLVLDRADFIPFLDGHPEVAARLIAVLCERVRWVSQNYEDALFLDLPGRLARKLLTLADAYGAPAPGGTRIDFRISQRELAEMAGVTRESVNKHMRAWQDRGLIGVEQGRVTVRDRAGLEKLVEPA